MYFLAEKIDSILMKLKGKEMIYLLNSREIRREWIIHYKKKNHNARWILRNDYVTPKLNWNELSDETD